jgi:hypothetical protein
MRLLLKNHHSRSKRIPEKSVEFAASGLFLSRKQEKSRLFWGGTVDSGRFCGTLETAEPETGKALASIHFALARFLLKPIGSINVLE